jgi:hypothetical protein
MQSKPFAGLRCLIEAYLLRGNYRQQAKARLKIYLIISPHSVNPHDMFEVPCDRGIRAGDVLTNREAFTTDVAEAVVDQLVNDRGLEFDRDAVPAPGRIVFVYRRARDTGYGAQDTGCGLRETRLGIRDSGARGAA